MNTPDYTQAEFKLFSIEQLESLRNEVVGRKLRYRIEYELSMRKRTKPNKTMKYDIEEIIAYMENTDLPIPAEKFFNKDGSHITKRQYGAVVIETLIEELRENFK